MGASFREDNNISRNLHARFGEERTGRGNMHETRHRSKESKRQHEVQDHRSDDDPREGSKVLAIR